MFPEHDRNCLLETKQNKTHSIVPETLQFERGTYSLIFPQFSNEWKLERNQVKVTMYTQKYRPKVVSYLPQVSFMAMNYNYYFLWSQWCFISFCCCCHYCLHPGVEDHITTIRKTNVLK